MVFLWFSNIFQRGSNQSVMCQRDYECPKRSYNAPSHRGGRRTWHQEVNLMPPWMLRTSPSFWATFNGIFTYQSMVLEPQRLRCFMMFDIVLQWVLYYVISTTSTSMDPQGPLPYRLNLWRVFYSILCFFIAMSELRICGFVTKCVHGTPRKTYSRESTDEHDLD